jgi:hypothetical protein
MSDRTVTREDDKTRPPCARGCTWKTGIENNGDPIIEPVPAEVGKYCGKCAGRFKRHIREIADLYALLDTRPVRADHTQHHRRGKASGSPALARLDVVVLQDWRTSTKARNHEDGDARAPESSIPEWLCDWAKTVAETLGIKQRPDTITDAITLLTGPWFENLCYLDLADDLWDDIQDKRRTLRRVNGISGPRRLGECNCGAPVYEPEPIRDQPGHRGPDTAVITCRQCGHRMNAEALARLAAKGQMRG